MPFPVLPALVFALTYLVLGLGALPPLKLDRSGAALVGATLMVALGAVSPADAARAIDVGTLALLLGMMIVAAHLRLAGFFGFAATRILGTVRSPRALLAATTLLSGVLSALFVNDPVCVLLTPLVLVMVETAGLPPLPFLLAVAMGSNSGSVATVVGNPQNMMIASLGGISYARFAAVLTPVALGALLLTVLVLDVMHGRRLPATQPAPRLPRVRLHRALLAKTLVVAVLLLVAMLAGAPPPLAAMGAASLLLVTRRVSPRRVHALVDGSLLAMFAGLFVVIEGVERTGLAAWLLARLTSVMPGGWGPVALTTLLSNLVSNVPAVMLLGRQAAAASDPEHARLVLAMVSTLAGNLTLVGSVANLIVVAQAEPRARVGFWEYTRTGLPVTLLTLAWGCWWLEP